jgi:hypothetical protein
LLVISSGLEVVQLVIGNNVTGIFEAGVAHRGAKKFMGVHLEASLSARALLLAPAAPFGVLANSPATARA